MGAWTPSRRGLAGWTVSTIGRPSSRWGSSNCLPLTRLILARPAFAMLDRVNAALKPAQVRQALRRLDENSITYITLAEDAESVELYDAVLEIDADGAWNWRRTGLQYKRRSEVNTSAIHMYPYRVVSLQLIYSALDRLMWMRWRSVQGDQTSQSISYVLGMEDRARQTRRPPISLECAFARGARILPGRKAR